jgi:tripartite-type tricarboxylate transporter receptor subunit TctC
MRLSAALTKILQEKAIVEKFAALGAEVRTGTPEEFTDYLRAEDAKWSAVIRDANIRAD